MRGVRARDSASANTPGVVKAAAPNVSVPRKARRPGGETGLSIGIAPRVKKRLPGDKGNLAAVSCGFQGPVGRAEAVGWVEWNEAHQPCRGKAWWASLRSTHPTP